MSINTENRVSGPYTGNGVTTTYPFDFKVFTDADVKAVQTDLEGVETTLTSSDYSISLNADQDDNPGGSVVLNSALTSGYLLTITSEIANLQPEEITNGGGFYPSVINDALDRVTILVQQLVRDVSRSIKIPVSDGELTTELSTAALRKGAALVFDSTTGAPSLSVDVAASAAAAETSANEAAASAAAAEAAVSSALWRDVVFLTAADSPRTITQADNGKLLAWDTSSGACVVNLPAISALTTPFTVGFKKTTNDGNSVTINRGGSDTIDSGLTSRSLASYESGITMVADKDPTPDRWVSATFGTVGGDLTVDKFSGNGSTTAFTLSADPGSKNNTQLYINGVYQQKATYSVSGTTLTTTTAPPSGTNNVEVVSGTTLSIGTPSNGTVSTDKIVDSAVTSAKIADGAVATAKLADTSVTNAKLAYDAVAYYNINAFWIASTAEIITGTASRLVSAAALAPMYYGCAVYQSSTQSIANATWTTVTFNAEEYDDDGWQDNATNNSRVTLNFTGRVVITAVGVTASGSGSTCGVRITKNGSVIATDQSTGVANGVSTDIAVTSGDYIEIQVIQSSGAAQNTVSGTAGCRLTVRRIK